jgi:serine/threonine protein kinase
MKPGDRFASYEVLECLGQGGMGEVFLARDARLGRDVALKLVKLGPTADPARLARFEREARLLAQLSHPSIAALLDLEGRDGAMMLVLEHVPGETLAERLARGPMSVDDALATCDQVAAALAAAHEAGVVHRDVKPGNVRIRPDGVVKLLDFGLAKALGPDDSDEGTDDETLSADRTSMDAVLGTPGDMSPEQARGKPADRRADAWAFGCLLYECLAGCPAFPGATRGDRLAAVLTHEPDFGRLPRRTPPGVRELL